MKERLLNATSEEKNKSSGINIIVDDNEVLIKGSKEDLIELSDYIKKIALLGEGDHIHLDELTIISNESMIENLIIEKE